MKQTLFNTMYLGLASQGFNRSVNSGGECVYRGPAGLKCAAGHLIPNDEYYPYMEGVSFDKLIGLIGENFLPHSLIKLCSADIEFVKRAQLVHDNCFTNCPNELKKQLEHFAEEEDLTIPAIP